MANKMINIAQCVYDLSRAGAQQVVSHIIAFASKDTYRMTVYTFKDGPVSHDIRSSGGIVRIVPQYIRYLDPLLIAQLVRLFRRDRIDVVHTHLFGADLHAGLAATLFTRIPAITTIHAVCHETWRQDLFAGWLFRRFKHIVAVGTRVAEYLTSSWPHLGSRVMIIPNGVPDLGDLVKLRGRSRRTLQIHEPDRLIGAIGRLSSEKAHLDLIEAFKIVASQDPNVKLAILGEGPLRAELEAARSLAGLDRRVIMPGNLPEGRLLVPGFDLFVLSSRWEGLPMALLEAMVAGVPCVATNVGGVGEVIRDQETGRLVSPGRPDLLAEAVLDLLRRPDKAAALGRAGQRLVSSKHSAADMSSAYQKIYQEMSAARYPDPG
jgi:glycosyltransferase involved in cell wall biosynthesis